MFVAFGGAWSEMKKWIVWDAKAELSLASQRPWASLQRGGREVPYLPGECFYPGICGHKRRILPSAESAEMPPSSTHMSALLHTLLAAVERERKAFEWVW